MSGRNCQKGYHESERYDQWREYRDSRPEPDHDHDSGHRRHTGLDKSDPDTTRHSCGNDHRPDGRDAKSYPHHEGDSGHLHQEHGATSGVSAPSTLGGELHWGEAAWAEAGGFEAVLLGHLFNALPGGGAPSPIFLVSIDQLDINFNTFIQNTLIENTQILFDADNGGSVVVGGDVTAISSQHALLDQPSGLIGLPDIS